MEKHSEIQTFPFIFLYYISIHYCNLYHWRRGDYASEPDEASRKSGDESELCGAVGSG